MIAAGHQPNYLPYCGFFHKVAHCDVFVIVDTVQFVKKGRFGWQHRNRIKAGGGWIWLTVPVLKKGRFYQKINEVEINNDGDWRRKHWRSIYLNYKNAPYFTKYSDFFEHIYKKRWGKLADLNMEIISYLLKALKIGTKVVKCSELGIDEGPKTHLLVDICKKVNSSKYLSGVHGRDYIDNEVIEKNNLRVLFQNFDHPVYSQGRGDFIPNLSVVDLLFRNGDKSADLVRKASREGRPHVE